MVHAGAEIHEVDMTTSKRRFTVSLDQQDYDALRVLAEGQRPPLKLQYMVELAVRNLLDQHGSNQLSLGLKRP